MIVFGALISVLVRHRITDPACGLRAMRSELTAAVVLEQPQYQASGADDLAALHGFRLAEVPTTMRDRGEHATSTKKGGNFGYGCGSPAPRSTPGGVTAPPRAARLRPRTTQCS